MKKTYLKIIFKEVKQSFGRFMAIFSIVTLGVGLLSGLIVTTPDMHYSVDEYYDEHNMADIFIKGTMGLTNDDIETLLSTGDFEDIMPAYVTDTLMENGKREIVTTRIYGLPLLYKNNGVKVNQLELIKGRMPKNNNECLVERKGGFLSDIPIGSKLKISTENDNYDDLDDMYNIKEYTVVGVVANSFYFSFEREVTNIGNGRLGAIIYVDESSYDLDVYTDFYMTAKGYKDLDAFSDEYDEGIEAIVKKLKNIGEERSKIRYKEILTEATDKLNEGKQEYEEAKLEAETELNDAYNEIQEGKADLVKAWKEIQDGKRDLEDAKKTLEEETIKANKEIEDARIELADALIELEDGEKELKDAWQELQDGEVEYRDGYKKYLDSQKELEKAQKKFDKGEKEYLDGKNKLADGKRELRKGEKELSAAQEELRSAQRQYDAGVKELQSQKGQFEQGIAYYIQALNNLPEFDFNFTSAEELFNAMDNDETGSINKALDVVVREAYSKVEGAISQIDVEISNMEDLKTRLESQLQELEEIPDPSEDIITQIEYLKNQLTQLDGGLSQAQAKKQELQAQLSQMPETADVFINGWQQIKAGEAKLADAKRQIDDGNRQIDRGWAELESGWEEIESAEKELNKAKKELDENRQKLEDGWAELEEGRIELEDARQKLDDGYIKYKDGRKELDDGWIEYYDGQKKLADAEVELKDEVEKAQKEIQDGEIDLNKGIREYYDGQKELAEGEADYIEAKAEAEKELSDALKEILDGEKEIEELERPKWYVLDRNYNMSYVSFIMNAEKVAAIAKVFPVFFYLIAALVALTTMTRMVEEERTQIGTLKALGYTKSTIMFKYLFYCGLASILGSALGLFIGFKLLPLVIWNAFGVMYHLPKFVTGFNIKIAVVSSGLAIFSTMIATFYACNNALKEKPSILMLPRAPKAGKRILLERVGFIWSRMSFNHKATARNLFRYKKHFFMTVIGIGGCTALLVTGFGLRDSIGDVANIQYKEIYNYDVLIDLDTKDDLDSSIIKILNDKSKTKNYMELFKDKGYGIANGERLEVNLFVTENLEELNQFINLRERKTKNNFDLDDNSIILTEKFSEVLNLKIGDTITIENSDEESSDFIVTGITEQYLGNTIYMSKDKYQDAFKNYETPNLILVDTPNLILVDTPEFTPYDQDKLISEILSRNGVLSAEFVGQTKRTYDNLLTSINYIVIVIIVASGALAFIVLYNLTNININERKKELATLKVLGFHNEEVSAYIFRETAILTIIGILVGLFLGTLLHAYIIKTIESTSYMFGRDVRTLSYIISTIITIVFSLIVNIFMSKKLRNIKMVDSMKAVD